MTAQPQPEEVPIIPAWRYGVTVLCAQTFLPMVVGLMLRLLFVFRFPTLTDDSETYLQLARNWADHHIYGLWLNGHLVPTDLRMPGYPAFLASVAILFRRSTRAIVLSQAGLDLGTCLLGGLLAAALAPQATRRRVYIVSLWLCCTCPFLANYSVAVLTETLATFLTTAALACFAIGLQLETSRSNLSPELIQSRRSGWLLLASFGAFLTGLATLVRPEMPLLLVVAALAYVFRYWNPLSFRKLLLTGLAMAVAFMIPLVPWAARNLITLHELQVLAPRYVILPGEFAPVGYYAWTGTWLERYRDVFLNVWKIGEERVDLEDLPDSAFDSPQEKARIGGLFDQYNNSDELDISPEMDREFAAIARDRTRQHPLRTYLVVPFQRALTIWFTPRTELLPIDGKLWPLADQWNDSHADVLTTAGLGVLGYLYVALAIAGGWFAWRNQGVGDPPGRDRENLWGIALVIVYLFARTAFLTTVEAPEPRYVVTCYPAVLAIGALWWSRATGAKAQKTL